ARAPAVIPWGRTERERAHLFFPPQPQSSRPFPRPPFIDFLKKIPELVFSLPATVADLRADRHENSRAPPTLPVSAAIGHNPLDARTATTRARVEPAERLWRAAANLLGAAAHGLFPHRMLSYRP